MMQRNTYITYRHKDQRVNCYPCCPSHLCYRFLQQQRIIPNYNRIQTYKNSKCKLENVYLNMHIYRMSGNYHADNIHADYIRTYSTIQKI